MIQSGTRVRIRNTSRTPKYLLPYLGEEATVELVENRSTTFHNQHVFVNFDRAIHGKSGIIHPANRWVRMNHLEEVK